VSLSVAKIAPLRAASLVTAPEELRGRVFAQLSLNNLSDYLLDAPPCLDECSGRFYYRAEGGDPATGFKPYWAGPLPLQISSRQRDHLRASIEARLSQVSLNGLERPPSGLSRCVPVRFGDPSSPAKQMAYVKGIEQPYWSGPIAISFASLPRA
jgi:hypothetical protein